VMETTVPESAEPVVRWRESRLVLHRGRAVAAVLVAAYFGLLLALGGYWQWRRLGVPAVKHGPRISFTDLRDLTSAWDCARRGIAVLPVNPCDPEGGGSANWPRLWLLPSHFGLGQSSTIPLAIALIVVFFFVAILVVPQGAGIATGVVYSLALCSPAVMFGPDYGNIDIAVFVVVGAAALLLRRRLAGLIGGEMLLFVASLLKLFPVVAVAALLQQRRRAAQLGAVAIVAGVATYVLANYAYISLALQKTAQADSASFGMRRFTEWLVLGVNTVSPRLAAGVNVYLTPRAWDVGVAIIIAVALLIFRRRLRSQLPAPPTPDAERDLDLFWVGASIYVCSYVVFRSWDYRLAFVLLTIPQLLRWAATKRALVIITTLALFGALWLDLTPPGLDSLKNDIFSPWYHLTSTTPFTEPLPPAVFAQLVLFVGLLAGLVGTLPDRWAWNRA
jgi:hypothetical protein